MSNRNYNRKLTPEQSRALAKIIVLSQEFNAERLAKIFETSPQQLQYHANKLKKEVANNAK